MPLTIGLLVSVVLVAEPPLLQRAYTASDEFSTAEPGKFRYRGTSFGFGVRGTVSIHCTGYWSGCNVSPFLAGTSEFGSRRARLAVELHMAPVPALDYDFLVGMPWIGLAVGGLFGNENIRGGVFALGGYYWWGCEGRLWITPWRTARGGRHGIELTAGWGLFEYMAFGVGYRWFPALLNHRRR
jgi:hypothetical protein